MIRLLSDEKDFQSKGERKRKKDKNIYMYKEDLF